MAGKAFILSHQHEIDKDDDDQKDVNRQIALAGLVIREALPTNTVTIRQSLGGKLLDRLDGLAAAETRCRGRLDGGGRIQIVTVDCVDALDLLSFMNEEYGTISP